MFINLKKRKYKGYGWQVCRGYGRNFSGKMNITSNPHSPLQRFRFSKP